MHAFATLEMPTGIDQLLYRYAHVSAGVVWIGMLLAMALVQEHVQQALAGEPRSRAIQAGVSRVVFFLQWASLFTWASGAALLARLYYAAGSAPLLFAPTSEHAGEHMPWSRILALFGVLCLGLAAYELVARVFARLPEVAALAWAALVVGLGCRLEHHFELSSRALVIHLGVLLGTVMALNVWLWIAPALLALVAAARAGKEAPTAALERARARARHNLAMATPILLLMVGVHQEELLGARPWQFPVLALLLLGVLVGWGLRRGSGLIRW